MQLLDEVHLNPIWQLKSTHNVTAETETRSGLCGWKVTERSPCTTPLPPDMVEASAKRSSLDCKWVKLDFFFCPSFQMSLDFVKYVFNYYAPGISVYRSVCDVHCHSVRLHSPCHSGVGLPYRTWQSWMLWRKETIVISRCLASHQIDFFSTLQFKCLS